MSSSSLDPADNLHAGITVPWTDVVRFVRQVSHDLRNHLNAIELQSAFVSELAADPELKEEIGRLRKMVSECGSALQTLTTRLNPTTPTRTQYGTRDFVEDLKAKIRKEFPKHADSVTWENGGGEDAQIAVDPQLLQEALLELFRNAFENETSGSSPGFIAATEGGNIVFKLYEPKSQFELATEKWGREPLRHVNRGHYGLGLNRARAIAEGHGGKLTAQYDAKQSKLITTITIPLDQT